MIFNTRTSLMDTGNFLKDIYTEPNSTHVDTRANLGPCIDMAATRRGTSGFNINLKGDVPQTQVYIKGIDQLPIDPQLFYGLRCYTHITKPDAREFTLRTIKDDPSSGICCASFLECAFDTVEFVIAARIDDDGSWTDEEETAWPIPGSAAFFHKTDHKKPDSGRAAVT